ncbi:UNVERIFIED_CONTAM: hypothetical protein FKN15_058451 [Acipenser sinensis]
MDQNDNDLQGTDGSGSLGGPDVRRRIPLKLINKQVIRNKATARTPRIMNRIPSKPQNVDEEGFGYNEEERYECKGGEVFGGKRRFPIKIFWDCKINLIGEKDDTPVHFCDKCGLPIKIYGRMINLIGEKDDTPVHFCDKCGLPIKIYGRMHGGPPVNAPPPRHYNPSSMQQFSEDQGTLSPPFTQPGGLSPGIWPAPRGPPPPRMQGPPPQGQIPGPHHPDQSRYRPYYQ